MMYLRGSSRRSRRSCESPAITFVYSANLTALILSILANRPSVFVGSTPRVADSFQLTADDNLLHNIAKRNRYCQLAKQRQYPRRCRHTVTALLACSLISFLYARTPLQLLDWFEPAAAAAAAAAEAVGNAII